MNKDDILFIIGASKTGTSSLVRMVNSHPDIFILFETLVGRYPRDKFSDRLFKVYPDAEKVFSYGVSPDTFYPALQRFFSEKGYPFKIVGNNAPEHGLDPDRLALVAGYKTVYMIRDVRTWIAKNGSAGELFLENDIVHAAIDYVSCFIASFSMLQVLHVRLEDIIHRNEEVVDLLEKFIGISLRPHINEWWKVSYEDPKHPKNAQRWMGGHTSASYGPQGVEDTQVVLAAHPFWDELLPIFDRYYGDFKSSIDAGRLAGDLRRLHDLKRFSPLPLLEAYARRESKPIRKVNPSDKKKFFFREVRRALGRIARKVFG